MNNRTTISHKYVRNLLFSPLALRFKPTNTKPIAVEYRNIIGITKYDTLEVSQWQTIANKTKNIAIMVMALFFIYTQAYPITNSRKYQ
jgi:TRAP-type C4-dicarboxylate transport system permease large subunit